jgi:hypothetical protein
MKNRSITHAHEQVKIYKHYYKPSLNPVRFLKSILVVIFSGSSKAAQGFDYTRKYR